MARADSRLIPGGEVSSYFVRRHYVSAITWCAAVFVHLFFFSFFLSKPHPPKGAGERIVHVEIRSLIDIPKTPESVDELTKGLNATDVKDASVSRSDNDSEASMVVHKVHYFEVRELTQKPLVKVDVPIEIMVKLSELVPQTVAMSLMINEYGDVDRVIVEHDSLPPETNEKLVDTFRMAKFHPGEIDGVPVKSHLRIVVNLDEPSRQTDEKRLSERQVGEKRGIE